MRISKYTIPVLVIITLFLGWFLKYAFTHPTTNMVFLEGKGEIVECIVEGVKCKGTAGTFSRRFAVVPGIYSVATYASEHRAVISYDPESLTWDDIKEIIEEPYKLADGTEVKIFKLMDME